MDTARRRSDLRTTEWSGNGTEGLVVYDPRTDNGFVLNTATAVVFELCDGTTTRQQMAERVAAATGLPTDTDIVDLALADLGERGLLDEPALAEPSGLSRRTLMRRLAIGAGAAALLPVVDAIGGVSRLAADPPAGANTPQGGIPPLVAEDKSATTAQDTPVDVTLSVSGGFVTPDSTAFRIQTDPTHGTVSLVGAVATYTPAAGFVGTDTFTYIGWQCVAFVDAVLACPDGTGPYPDAGSDPATVTITVEAPATTTTAAATTTEAQPAVGAVSQPRFTG